MTTTMTLRELANNPQLLEKYSSIDLIDKRKKKRRGVYLSELEAKKYRAFQNTQNTINTETALPDFFGMGTGMIGDLTKEEEKEIRYQKYM